MWWLLKQLHEKHLLYRGHRVLPYCPRCGTTLSSHELALGYEDVRDKSIYVTVPVDDDSKRELVIWTTTPWTLPSNVAVAVHPGSRLRHLPHARRPAAIRLAASRSAIGSRPERSATATRSRRSRDASSSGCATGARSTWCRSPTPASIRSSSPGDFVTATDGSGLVHMAPAFGSDDYAAGQAHGLALLRPVAADGTFQGTTWPELEGLLVTADATNDLIIRKLKDLGRHLRTEQHTHSYPHCWRCQSKLIYYARDSWFVRTSAIKDRMARTQRRHRLASARDRQPALRRVARQQRRLGAVARALLGHAAADLGQRSRPGADRSRRILRGAEGEVGLRAGAGSRCPQAVGRRDHVARARRRHHAPRPRSDRHLVRFGLDAVRAVALPVRAPGPSSSRTFPADYICEGIDQTRGWFYSLLAIATAVFDAAPYRNVIVNELVLDAYSRCSPGSIS